MPFRLLRHATSLPSISSVLFVFDLVLNQVAFEIESRLVESFCGNCDILKCWKARQVMKVLSVYKIKHLSFIEYSCIKKSHGLKPRLV